MVAHKLAAVLCLTLTAVLWPAADASAAVSPNALQIQISGFDFTYDESQDGSLFDGTGSIAEATQVMKIEFYIGGKKKYSMPYDEGLYIDFLIDGIFDIPDLQTNGTANIIATTSSNSQFNLLSSSLGKFLSLDLETVTATYVRNKIGQRLQLSFTAKGPSAAVLSQALPFDLIIDENQPISVRVSTSSLTASAEDGFLTGFTTSGGSASVSGQVVPEPQSFAALLGLGLFFLHLNNWRRRGRKQRL